MEDFNIFCANLYVKKCKMVKNLRGLHNNTIYIELCNPKTQYIGVEMYEIANLKDKYMCIMHK